MSVEDASAAAFAANRQSMMFQLTSLALPGAGIGLLVGLFCFNETHLTLSLKMIFAAILLLSAKRWTGTVLLVFIQLDLFFTESRRSGFQGGLNGMVASVTFCLLVLCLLMFISRYRSLRQTSGVSFMNLLRGQWLGETKSSDTAAGTATAAGTTAGTTETAGHRAASFLGVSLTVQSLLIAILRLLVICLAATVLLTALPQSLNSREWLTETADGNIFLWPGPALLVMIAGLLVVLSEIDWRQQSASQASLYLRSVFLKGHAADMRRMVLRKLKATASRRKKREDV